MEKEKEKSWSYANKYNDVVIQHNHQLAKVKALRAEKKDLEDKNSKLVKVNPPLNFLCFEQLIISCIV